MRRARDRDRCRGDSQFVTDGETGLLVAPGEPGELAAGLHRILGTPGLLHDLAVAARAGAVARHTLAALGRGSRRCVRGGGPEGLGSRLCEDAHGHQVPAAARQQRGDQRSLAIARRLAELGDLVLCGYDDGTADRSGLRELGIDVRAVPWRVTPGQVARGVIAARSISAGRFWSAAMVKTVRRAADEKAIDLLQVEYQQMVPSCSTSRQKGRFSTSTTWSRHWWPATRAPGGVPPLLFRLRRPPSARWSGGPSEGSTTWSWSASRSGRG